MKKTTIRVCQGHSCCQRNKGLLEAAKKKEGPEIQVEESACLGQCQKGPNVQMLQGEKREIKNKMSPRKIEEEIDIFSGKKKRIETPKNSAKSTVSNLLSGGF